MAHDSGHMVLRTLKYAKWECLSRLGRYLGIEPPEDPLLRKRADFYRQVETTLRERLDTPYRHTGHT